MNTVTVYETEKGWEVRVNGQTVVISQNEFMANEYLKAIRKAFDIVREKYV